MCYHRDRLEWAALREEALVATEATDEAEPDVVEERDPLAPAVDD